MNSRRIRTIAWWEYSRKAREKGFLISLILTPILVIAMSVLPGLLLMQKPTTTKRVGVVDGTEALLAPLRARLAEERLADGKPAYELLDFSRPGGKIDSTAGDALILSDSIEGTVVITGTIAEPHVSYRSSNPNNLQVATAIGHRIDQAVTSERMRRAGMDAEAYEKMRADIDITPIKVTKSGEAKQSEFMAEFFLAIGGVMILLFLVMTAGQTLVRGMVEERSNRILELLVSEATPSELLWGKLIGLSGLGLTQMGVWGLLAVGGVSVLSMLGNGAGAGTQSTLDGVYKVLPFIILFLTLGYLFFAGIFVGIGSLVTTEQEAQVITSYLTLFLVMPLVIAMNVMQNPDAAYVHVMTLIPPLTPAMMMIRLVTQTPEPWEIAAAAGVLALSTAFMVWASAKIFRTALLMTGKRPGLREIVHWLREA